MHLYGYWDNTQDYRKAFHSVVSEIVREPDEREKPFSVGKRLRVQSPNEGEIMLEEAGEMKIICDAYFIRTLNEAAKRWIRFTKG